VPRVDGSCLVQALTDVTGNAQSHSPEGESVMRRGDVVAHSDRPGRGTTFELVLPGYEA
jgi:hypothetical protein